MDATRQRTLADMRQEAELSKAEVARRMGVYTARVAQIEQDFPRVRFNVVQNYIHALGGLIRFSTGTADVLAIDLQPDPRGPRDHGYRKRPTAAADGSS